jgi:hypothetical protein
MNAAELKAAVIARAQQDHEYREALLADPRGAIEQLAGGALPDGFAFDPSTDLELTDAELELVAGGNSDRKMQDCGPYC